MNKSSFDLGVPFLAGGVVFLLVAYSTGLMTPANRASANIAAARIDERAIVCQEAAVAYLAQHAGDPAAAAGEPKALAEQFYVASGNLDRDRMGRDECSKKLSA